MGTQLLITLFDRTKAKKRNEPKKLVRKRTWNQNHISSKSQNYQQILDVQEEVLL